MLEESGAGDGLANLHDKQGSLIYSDKRIRQMAWGGCGRNCSSR